MKRRLLALCGALTLLLGGCASGYSGQAEAQPEQSLTVYRLAEDGSSDALTGQELLPYPEDGGSPVQAAAKAFAAPSQTEGLVRALPAGVRVEDCTLANGVATLTLSEKFLDARPMEQTAAAMCAALTLCALEGVEATDIAVGDKTVFAGLTPADALLRDTDTNPSARRLRLYFADESGERLASEYHSLTLAEDAAADRYVMEELLRGPYSPRLASALPEGTRLLSCATADGTCTVDLSEEFYENRPDTALGARLAVYSIVNSLTALPQVDSVTLLVRGEPVEAYGDMSLTGPLRWDGQAVRPAVQEK